jgi:hypothetical protein
VVYCALIRRDVSAMAAAMMANTRAAVWSGPWPPAAHCSPLTTPCVAQSWLLGTHFTMQHSLSPVRRYHLMDAATKYWEGVNILPLHW